MPAVLRPCPQCGRMMETARAVCVYCQQQPRPAAPPAPVSTQPPQQVLPPASPPQHVYYQPVHVYPAAPAPRSEVCGILSVIFGALTWGLFCIGGVFAVPGLILGIIGLVRVQSDPMLTGKATAIVGIALCGSFVALWAVLMLWAYSQTPAIPAPS